MRRHLGLYGLRHVSSRRLATPKRVKIQEMGLSKRVEKLLLKDNWRYADQLGSHIGPDLLGGPVGWRDHWHLIEQRGIGMSAIVEIAHALALIEDQERTKENI